jgi:hypothetical protein
LLADIAVKHQDAGQSVPLQISASLVGERSAYRHRYVGLNSVPCILFAWLTSLSDLVGKVKKRAIKPWIRQEIISKMDERRK